MLVATVTQKHLVKAAYPPRNVSVKSILGRTLGQADYLALFPQYYKFSLPKTVSSLTH